MNAAAIDFSILWPALIAGLLVIATHVPLGIQVLGRGIVGVSQRRWGKRTLSGQHGAKRVSR